VPGSLHAAGPLCPTDNQKRTFDFSDRRNRDAQSKTEWSDVQPGIVFRQNLRNSRRPVLILQTILFGRRIADGATDAEVPIGKKLI